jgi:hypothetical protein
MEILALQTDRLMVRRVMVFTLTITNDGGGRHEKFLKCAPVWLRRLGF